jgi:hypothetical protein
MMSRPKDRTPRWEAAITYSHLASRALFLHYDDWRRSRRLPGGNHVESKDPRGLAGAAALLMLSACVSRDEVASLDRRVSTLESQVTAAQSRAACVEARASQLEAVANQCAATCQDVKVRAEQIYRSMV